MEKNKITIYILSIILTVTFGLSFQNQANAAVAPVNVVAVSGNGQVVLTWTNPADSTFRYIRIYRSIIFGQMGDYLADKIQGTSYTDLNVVNGTTYYYNVRAMDNTTTLSTNTTQVSATPVATVLAVPVVINTSAEKSTVEVSPKAIVADSIQTSDITVTIKDADGNPLPDKAVTIYSSRGINDIIPVTVKQTDASGKAMFEIKSNVVGYATITAMNGDIQLIQTGVVTIIPVPVIITPVPTKSLVSGGLYRASGDTKVYIIENDTKRWIKTAEEFVASGYKWDKILEVSAEALSAYLDAAVSALRVKINTAALRVRSIGSTSGAVIGRVLGGEIYSVIEESKGWYKIQASSGVIGWIMGIYAVKL